MNRQELEAALKELNEDFTLEITATDQSGNGEPPQWDVTITAKHPQTIFVTAYAEDVIDCEDRDAAIDTVIENCGEDILDEAKRWIEDNIEPEFLRLTIDVDAGSYADYSHNDGGDFTIWPDTESETIHVAIRGDEEGYLENPNRVPLGWLNSAQIYAEPGMDQVTFTISVGDPRGAHAFRIYRDNEGVIHITFPTPDQGMLHTPLKEIRPGHYIVSHE